MLREKKTVKLISDYYPVGSAKGLSFPHLTSKLMFNENGFKSSASERKAHNILLDLVRNQPPKSVIDLGCGNMALLRKMEADFGSYTFGVDILEDRKPNLVEDIFKLKDFPGNFDLCLISRARIKEQPGPWYDLLRIIEKRCKFLVLYSYDGDTQLYPTGLFTPVVGISDYPVDAMLYGKTDPA
jgi:SAM-dependent methyltransferase